MCHARHPIRSPGALVRLTTSLCLAGLLVLTAASGVQAATSWTEYSRQAREELRMRNYRAAEELYVKSLKEAEKADGGSGVRSETALRNLEHLVDLYRERGQTEDFVRVTEVVLDATQRVRGSRPAGLQAEVGRYYLSQERLDDASRHLEASLATLEAASDRDEPAIQESLTGMARLRQDQGRLEDAEVYYERALEVAKKRAPGSRTTVLAANDLAWFYVETDRNEEALPLARQAVDDFTGIEGKITEKVMVADTLGMAQINLGEYEDALGTYRFSLREPEDADRPKKVDPELTEVYEHFITVLRATDRDLEAERVENRLDRALKQQERYEELIAQSRGKSRGRKRDAVPARSAGSSDEEDLYEDDLYAEDMYEEDLYEEDEYEEDLYEGDARDVDSFEPEPTEADAFEAEASETEAPEEESSEEPAEADPAQNESAAWDEAPR